MFSSAESKGNGKGKEKAGTSSRTPSPESTKPTYAELEYAVATIAEAFDTIGVKKYGMIGGGAVALLSHKYGLITRQTDDLDLIILPLDTSADIVSGKLTTDKRVKEKFASLRDGYIDKPHVIIHGHSRRKYIPIEIFDWQVWPDRRQYYNLDLPANAPEKITINNKQISILSPGWLLRQKIMAFANRQKKRGADMADIENLSTILMYRKETIVITDASETQALKTLLDDPRCPDLKKVIRCEAI